MPLINWDEATAADLSAFTADLLWEELGLHQLDVVGSKEDIINRLLTHIMEHRPTPTPEPSDATHFAPAEPLRASPAIPAFTNDPVENVQLLLSFLQQNPAFVTPQPRQAPQVVHVTTLPDLSSSLPTFSGDGGISARRWIEDLECTQQLASWEPSTLLAIALGKLRGPAADWKVTAGYIWRSWPEWKAAFQEQFGDRLSLIQWQEKVSARKQGKSETVVNYSLAKLNILARCPLTLTDKQRVEYVVQGIRDKQVATPITVQGLETIAAFLDVVRELNRTLDHARMQPGNSKRATVPQTTPSAKPRASVEIPQQFASASHTPLTPRSRTAQRLSLQSPEQRDARYDISIKHRAPAFRLGQNIDEAICYNCCSAGHLSSKCLQRKSSPSSSRPPNAFSSHAFDELEGSKLVCVVVPANVAGVGISMDFWTVV